MFVRSLMLARQLLGRRLAVNRRCYIRALSSADSSGIPGFTTVIGLEVHAQLQIPSTKLFSRAPGATAGRGLGPNEAVSGSND